MHTAYFSLSLQQRDCDRPYTYVHEYLCVWQDWIAVCAREQRLFVWLYLIFMSYHRIFVCDSTYVYLVCAHVCCLYVFFQFVTSFFFFFSFNIIYEFIWYFVNGSYGHWTFFFRFFNIISFLRIQFVIT